MGRKTGLCRSAKRLTRVPTAKLLFISAFSRILSILAKSGGPRVSRPLLQNDHFWYPLLINEIRCFYLFLKINHSFFVQKVNFGFLAGFYTEPALMGLKKGS